MKNVGLGGLGLKCSPRDPRFTCSNPGEVDGFFSERKYPEHKSSGRDFKLGVSSLSFQIRYKSSLILKSTLINFITFNEVTSNRIK